MAIANREDRQTLRWTDEKTYKNTNIFIVVGCDKVDRLTDNHSIIYLEL